jgi:NitT/TauT family transport system ATP-binding protein
MISFIDVTFSYPGSTPVFENFAWQVAHGERWAVLGPSGCGKSTLLLLLAGLQKPISGQILIADQNQSGPRPQTGLILQDYGLLPWATARMNVKLGLDIRRFYGPDGKHTPADFNAGLHEERVDIWIDRLGLTPHIDKYPAQLSGGQRQRVAIARTLALNPDLLLMDEPFSSLDAPTRVSLQDQTFELSREQMLTLIIVTHSIEEAAVMGEQILLLGHPPNHQTKIFPNRQARDRHFRETAAYFEMCRRLRLEMEPSS